MSLGWQALFDVSAKAYANHSYFAQAPMLDFGYQRHYPRWQSIDTAVFSAGVETVTTMRQHSQETPIVVLTGMSDEETSTACVQAGATEFLSKTDLTAHKLERVIFVTLGRHATA